jgi:precorrin-6B methylase 1
MEAGIQPHFPRTTSPSFNFALTVTAAMEALGAAASVAGLVSLAIEIPKLIDTAISIRSAPDEAKQLSQTAGALITTLQRLEAFLKTDEARDLDMAADSALTVSISACQSRVLALSKKLRSHSPQATGSGSSGLPSIKAAATRFRWPFDKTECLSLISEIHAMQSTFEFCLIMKNW